MLKHEWDFIYLRKAISNSCALLVPQLLKSIFVPKTNIYEDKHYAPTPHLGCTISLFHKDKGWYFFQKGYNFPTKCIPCLTYLRERGDVVYAIASAFHALIYISARDLCHSNIQLHIQFPFLIFPPHPLNTEKETHIIETSPLYAREILYSIEKGQRARQKERAY